MTASKEFLLYQGTVSAPEKRVSVLLKGHVITYEMIFCSAIGKCQRLGTRASALKRESSSILENRFCSTKGKGQHLWKKKSALPGDNISTTQNSFCSTREKCQHLRKQFLLYLKKLSAPKKSVSVLPKENVNN